MHASTVTRKRRGPRMSRTDREAVMLDAAQSVFGARHFRDASMEAIAERSGVTKALLYQYFGSKEKLYEACIERARAELFDEIERRVAEVEPGRAQLEVFVQLYFAYLDEHRDEPWLLYGEASREAVNEMRDRNAEAIAAIFRRAVVASGRVPDEQGLDVLAHTLVGAGEQVGRWWLRRSDVPRAQAVDRFLVAARGAVTAVFEAMNPAPR